MSKKAKRNRLNNHISIQVRRATYDKLRQIGKSRRWSLVEAVDASVDQFMATYPAEFAGETPAATSETQLPERRSA